MNLEVKIQKRLKEFQLEASFSVGNECVGLMGPSGSGKSMTLKCIAGIEQPDSGEIILNKNPLFDSSKKIDFPPQKRKIGYLFQGYALFPNMTVEENIQCGLKAKKLAKLDRARRTEEMMEKFRIKELAKRYPRQLSGGQKQRTALARLMAYGPDVILLDEPFSALDEALRDELQQELFHMLAEYQKPSILVSHDLREIRRLCKKHYTIKEGRIQPNTDSAQKKARLPL